MKKLTEIVEDPSLSQVLDTLHGSRMTMKRWNKFVDALDPFLDGSAITGHEAIAFFWLLTREFRQTTECKTKIAEICKDHHFKEIAEVLDLCEQSQ